MSLDCGGLTLAWIDEAGFVALTMASKLPSAKKYQRWVFSELAEQMTDMLPNSASFIHLSLSDSLSALNWSISSAGTNSAATCDFHASNCCLNLQVDAALSAGQLRQSLQTAFQQKQWQWAYLLRMAMTFMPATLGRSDDLRKLPWSCLALRTQDGTTDLYCIFDPDTAHRLAAWGRDWHENHRLGQAEFKVRSLQCQCFSRKSPKSGRVG